MVVQPKMNGVECSALGLTLKSQDIPRGCAQTDVRTVAGRAYADLTSRPGGYPAKGPMTAKLVFWAGPGEELAEAGVRAAMAWDGRQVEYMPPDFGGLCYKGVAACEVTQRTVNRVEITVTLTADPVAYAEYSTAANLAAGANVVTIEGSHPARPVFRLTPSGASAVPAVADGSTGQALTLASAPGEGKAVVLDCEARTATVDGATARVTLESDWLALTPGTHTLRLTGCKGTIGYRGRWA